MLKKICLIVAALILMTGSAFARDCHFQILLTVHQDETESSLSADVFFCENKMILISSLFPSFFLSLQENTDSILSITEQESSFDSFYIPPIMTVMKELIQVMNLSENEGMYSGDLFDAAGLQASGTYTIEEFLSLPEMISAKESADQSYLWELVQTELKELLNQTDLTKVIVHFSLYDNGKYLTLTGTEEERTIFTVSFDFSGQNTVKAVLGYAENGSNYYWVSEYSVLSEDEIRLTCGLFADNKQQGYRSIVNSQPILTENWQIQLSDNRKEMSVAGEMIPGNGTVPAEFSGCLSLENLSFQARIGFRNTEGTYLNISAVLDDAPVHTEGLKAFAIENLSDLPDIGTLTSEISQNIIPFMLQIIQLLPGEYSDLLFPAD